MALKQIKKRIMAIEYCIISTVFPRVFYFYKCKHRRCGLRAFNPSYSFTRYAKPRTPHHSVYNIPRSLSLSLSHTHTELLRSKLRPSAPMAAGLSTALTPKPFRLFHHSHLLPKPTTLFAPSVFRHRTIKTRRKICLTVCVIMEDHKQNTQLVNLKDEVPESDGMNSQIPSLRVAEKLARKKSERFTYLVAAVMSTFGITSMAIMAVYYRFSWQMEVLFSLSLSLSRYMFVFVVYLYLLEIGFCFGIGRWSAHVWNVWYICSICWCCCKFSLSFFGNLVDWKFKKL